MFQSWGCFIEIEVQIFVITQEDEQLRKCHMLLKPCFLTNNSNESRNIVSAKLFGKCSIRDQEMTGIVVLFLELLFFSHRKCLLWICMYFLACLFSLKPEVVQILENYGFLIHFQWLSFIIILRQILFQATNLMFTCKDKVLEHNEPSWNE